VKPSQPGTDNELRPLMSRRRGLAAIAALVAGGALTACSAGSEKSAGPSTGTTAQAVPTTPAASITITPKDNSNNASILNSGLVQVSGGKLVSVSMTTASGTKIVGTLSSDGTSWKPNSQLDRATRYVVQATAKDSGNQSVVAKASFTTVSQADSFIGYYTPDNGTTVGVGMPVSFNFDKPVTNKKAVQQALTVTSSSGQEIVGHWFSEQRLDFRPEQYWTPNSTVTVKIALDGVEGASGIFGVQSKTVSFKVGRSQISTADDKTKTMTVVRDGRTLKTIPVSLGAPGHTTYNGTMVISEQYQQIDMNSQTVGLGSAYNIPDVPHAQRLTTSGTFVHGNYWRPASTFGSEDTSHGCVGLQDAKGGNNASMPGYWFYHNSLLGDVVIVKNCNDGVVAPDNGLNGWNLSWSDWKAGSAV